MRISDWSSDVCSSDLAAIARDRAEGFRLLMATAAPEFYAGAIAEALGFDAIVATRHRRDAAGNWQIGSASCRERVCQYVEISVVAVSLKTKSVTQTTTAAAKIPTKTSAQTYTH